MNRLLGKPTKTVVALALLGIPYVASASGELSALQTGKNEASISQRQVNNYQQKKSTSKAITGVVTDEAGEMTMP